MNKRTVAALVLLVTFSITADLGIKSVGVDDWQYSTNTQLPREPVKISLEKTSATAVGKTYGSIGTAFTSGASVLGIPAFMMIQGGLTSGSAASLQSANSQLGYAAGGAKDVNNFRDNIQKGYLPLKTDITYEGLFYEYFFDTGKKKTCEQLFCPSYSKAVSKDPISGEKEHFMTVGLNSNLEPDEFERKKLNLVIAMDISGSMGSSFDNYYYDRFGNRKEVERSTGKSKMQVAKRSLKGLTKHLGPEDRLGVVLFNNNAKKAKPLNKVKKVDMGAIRAHISEIRPGGGTNMDAGMRKATEMLERYEDVDQSEYENRVIFMTDAMPNIGRTSDRGLMQMAEENSEKNIHTSLVGIGVDFNTELVDAITSIEGANYFSVHSSEQFRNRMDRDFKYMVTPLVYDLKLELNSNSYSLERVYGSSAADESTGKVLRVNTLFPSRSKNGETKGGVVLVKLDKKSKGSIELDVSYENREGEKKKTSRTVRFKREKEHYENSGIRKAVVLSRYAELMKSWIASEREEKRHEEYDRRLGEQERTSRSLSVSKDYEEKMKKFKKYLVDEKSSIGDDKLQREIETLEQILKTSGNESNR